MPKPKGGLGRGLDSLFADTAPESGEGNAVTTLTLREISPDPDQPRKHFEESALAQLAQSITENGLLQPIAVRPQKTGTGYTIIAGERRWRAARMAGLDEVPVIIREVNDQQAAELALIENLQREDLDPLETAEGYRQLLEKYGMTQETAAKRIGKSRSALANALRLLSLPEGVQAALRAGRLSVGHAKVLLGLPTAQMQAAAAEQVIAQDWNVRQTEAFCKKLLKAPKPAPDPMRRPKQATEIEAALKEVTGSEVKVDYKKGKGTLQIAFYSEQQLRQYAKLLGEYDPEE